MRSHMILLASLFSDWVASEPLLSVLARNNATLSTLNRLLATTPSLAALLPTLRNATVLAPSDAAFARLVRDDAQWAAVTERNPALVDRLLRYHVLVGGGAFSGTPQFVETLLDAGGGGGGERVELLREDGFDMVFSGGKQMSMLVVKDIPNDGGVLHVLDRVLVPPPPLSALLRRTAGLSSLLGALTLTGLLPALDSPSSSSSSSPSSPIVNAGGITVFAPLDEAFRLAGTALTGLGRDELRGVLAYHVVASSSSGTGLFSTDLQRLLGASSTTPGTAATLLGTVGGRNLTIRAQPNGAVFVDSARLVLADLVVAGGGVVHVVDGVLNPGNAGGGGGGAVLTTTTTTTTTTTGPGGEAVVAFPGAKPLTRPPFVGGVDSTTAAAAVVEGGAGGRTGRDEFRVVMLALVVMMVTWLERLGVNIVVF